jgi:lysophospholipase L1-like esterase
MNFLFFETMNLKSRPQKKLSSFFKQSLTIVCIVICIFLVLELAFRLLLPDFHKVQQGPFRKGYQIDPLITSGVFLLDEHTFWKVAPDEKTGVNNAGFRDRNSTTTDKADGIYRIICIGDSVTFGVPIHRNPPEKTFPTQLESLIGKRFGPDKVEVLNAGNPGYTSYQGLKQLKTRLLKYKPDLLIIQFGINDSSPAVGQTDKEQAKRSKAVLSVYNALSKSAVCRAIVKLIRRNPKDIRRSDSEKQRVSHSDFKKNMLMFMALGKLHDFECLFIRPVIFENGKLLTDYKLPFPNRSKIVDMLTSFKNYRGDPARFFHDDCHLTPEGHDLFAIAIFDAIIKYEILKTETIKDPAPPGNTGSFKMKFEESQ